MSRHFDLLQRANKDLGRSQPWEPTIKVSEQPVIQGETYSTSVIEEEIVNWLRPIRILQNHWKPSVLFALTVLFSVASITYLAKPVYEAQARIEIDPPGEVFSLDSNTSVSSDRELLQTQAEVLRSDSIAIAVIRKLHLDQNDELVGPVKFEANKASITQVSDPLQLTQRERIALDKFRALLNVKRDASSRLILVSFRSHDSRLAAEICNTLVQSFIDQSFQTRNDVILKSSEWLSRQLDDIRAKMESSTSALAQFQGTIGVVDADDNKNTFTEHMGELTRQLTQAEAERIQLQALLKSVETTNPDSLPEVRSNPVVQRLSQTLAEQRAQLSQVLVVYGKNHPTAKKLQSQVDELQRQLDEQKSATVNSLRASYAAAEARERLMAAEMKGTTKELDQMARYSALKKDVETNVELYNTLYAKIKEAGISAASKSATINVVDQAEAPTIPVRRRRTLLLAGLAAALFGGVLLAFVLEISRDKLRSPEDIRRWIGSSSVSVIPVIGECEQQSLTFSWPKRMVRLLPSAMADDEARKDMFLVERPDSPEAEALQGLYGSLMLACPENPPQVFLIASAFPGEGKTTVALNLSLALAKHASTCLVDADLRKGRIAKAFALPAQAGLRDVLTDSRSLESVLVEVPGLANLSIVSTGQSQDNSGQLICSDTMRQVLLQLRHRFRFVVVDSAPIIPFVDGRALSTMADAVVLVGRAGVTTRGAMRRSIDLLSEIHAAPILNIVLNGANPDATDYKYYQYRSTNYSPTAQS